jgi:predicted dehydrogenase
MRVLILGNSAIAQKRLVPALESLSEITGVEIASRSAPDVRFPDYETALAESAADLVYISLVNSEHAHWAQRALEQGRHVVIDKPAFLALEAARGLVELSRRRGLCLAEATVYTRHPQIEAMRACFEQPGAAPICIFANFSFPPLAAENFRYRKALGGGALYDLGPYAVSPGRIFWGGRPLEVECRTLSTDGTDEVDTAFSVLLRYPKGRSLLGHFGFTTAYRNRLTLLGPECCVEVDRVFTTPPELENELRVWQQSGSSNVKVSVGDCFALFIREVAMRIRNRDLDGLREELLDDAFVLDWMRRSAGRDS